MILTAEKIMTPMNNRYSVPVSESSTAMSGLGEHLRKKRNKSPQSVLEIQHR